MRQTHLELLKCPKTGEDLVLEVFQSNGEDVIDGVLKSSQYEYKITNGIPRFVEDEGYSGNFGWQWNKWARIQFEDENVGRPMAGHTTNMFQKITELDKDKLDGKVVLDIGCGPGRFVDVARSMGADVVAIDYSSAIDAARENFSDDHSNILFVQGDALNLSFKDNVFDYSFSIGVLHHTPDPYKGVEEAFRVTKPQGEFAISVYRGGYYSSPTVQIWQKLFKASWPFFGHRLPYLYSQTVGRVNHYLRRVSRIGSLAVRIFFPSVTLPDVRWSVLDTFDSITPSYQSAHNVYEVYKWFQKAGFKDIRVAAWENIIGRK